MSTMREYIRSWQKLTSLSQTPVPYRTWGHPSMSTWARLVRFIPESGGPVLLGEPVDADIDVGLAMYTGEVVEVEVFDGCSVLAPGVRTGTRAKVGRLLSPVSHAEVGTIRCVGLNVSVLSLLSSLTLIHSKVRHACSRSGTAHAGSPECIPEARTSAYRTTSRSNLYSKGLRKRQCGGLGERDGFDNWQELQGCSGRRRDGIPPWVLGHSRVMSM